MKPCIFYLPRDMQTGAAKFISLTAWTIQNAFWIVFPCCLISVTSFLSSPSRHLTTQPFLGWLILKWNLACVASSSPCLYSHVNPLSPETRAHSKGCWWGKTRCRVSARAQGAGSEDWHFQGWFCPGCPHTLLWRVQLLSVDSTGSSRQPFPCIKLLLIIHVWTPKVLDYNISVLETFSLYLCLYNKEKTILTGILRRSYKTTKKPAVH